MTDETSPTTDLKSETENATLPPPDPFKLECKTPYGSVYLEIPHGAPLGGVHDAIVQFKSYIINTMMSQHQKETTLPTEDKPNG